MKNIEIDFLANNEGFIKEIAGYWSREWSESFDELSIQKKAEKIKKQVSRNELPVVFVAKDGNQLLGTAALLISDLEDRPELSPWLADVYVLKEFEDREWRQDLLMRLFVLRKRRESQGFTYLPSTPPDCTKNWGGRF